MLERRRIYPRLPGHHEDPSAGLAQLPAAFSSVALLLEPLVAAVIAWPLFGEHLGPVEIAGGVLVLAGIYVSRRGS